MKRIALIDHAAKLELPVEVRQRMEADPLAHLVMTAIDQVVHRVEDSIRAHGFLPVEIRTANQEDIARIIGTMRYINDLRDVLESMGEEFARELDFANALSRPIVAAPIAPPIEVEYVTSAGPPPSDEIQSNPIEDSRDTEGDAEPEPEPEPEPDEAEAIVDQTESAGNGARTGASESNPNRSRAVGGRKGARPERSE